MVAAGRGLGWYVCGWSLFQAQPLVWLGWLLLLAAFLFLTQVVPLVGGALYTFLSPALTAGVYYGARQQARGGGPELGQLFQGFRDPRRRGPLLVLGGLYLGLSLVVFFLLLFAVSGMVLSVISPAELEALEAGRMDPREILDRLRFTPPVVVGVLVSLTLLTVVLMAMWFAPILVMLGGREPLAALLESFRAWLRNWLPLSLFGLVFLPLAFLAALPFGLGLLILMPVAMAAVYCSYDEIFGDGPAPAGALHA